MTPRTTTQRLTSAAVLAAVFALPAAVAGQQVVHDREGSMAAAMDSSTATRLSVAADSLQYGTPREWRRAARLHQRSAALRPVGDPQADRSMMAAGRAFYYGGDLPRARAVIEDAAVRALARGDLVTAVHAEIDAGFIAQEQGDAAAANRLGEMAEILATSPLLTAAQRASALDRIVDARYTRMAARERP